MKLTLTAEEEGFAAEVMSVCALRYDGSGSPIDARRVLDRIAETGELDADPEANFAAFHLVQRATRHWGCGLLWDHDPWQVAAGFLFLELRNQEPPAGRACPQACAQWKAGFSVKAERAADLVRRWLVSERPGVKIPLWNGARKKKYGVPIRWSDPEPDDEPRKSGD